MSTTTPPIHPRRAFALRVLDFQARQVEEQRANVATIPDDELPLTPQEQAVKAARLAVSDGMVRVAEALGNDPDVTDEERQWHRVRACELLVAELDAAKNAVLQRLAPSPPPIPPAEAQA